MCLLCGRSGAGRVTGARTSIVKALRRSVKAKSRRFSPRRLVLFGFRARSPSRSFPALTRHCAGGFYRQVNCRPARRWYWPVLAPAKAFVRAESKRRGWCGIRNAELGRGNECVRHCGSGEAGGIGLRLALCSVVTFCIGLRLALRFCCGGLPSEYARRCGSVVAFAFDARPSLQFYWAGDIGLRLALRSVVAVCIGLRLALRFCCGVLPSVHACCLPHGDKQDGLRYLAFLFRRSRSPFVRSRDVLRLSAFVGSLWVWAFLCGDLDGVPGTRGTENGKRSWRRGPCALLRNRIGFAILSAGSTLGLRAPDCAKESSTLWTLFRGWSSEKVRFMRRFALVRIRAVTRVHGKT